MADLIVKINEFTLPFHGVDRLLMRSISSPYSKDGQWYKLFYIELQRSGELYETKVVEKKNLEIPLSLAGLFDKFITGDITPEELGIVNYAISNFNPDIVISEDYSTTPTAPVVDDPDPLFPPIEEEGEGNNEE